jgi:hypothetical protein
MNLPPGKYICGSGTLVGVKSKMTEAKFDMGNHTVDHLESNSSWKGIPAPYKSDSGGWKFSADGVGPGIAMDQPTWEKILKVNDAELKELYGPSINLKGFRAPRLELNDNGLKALSAISAIRWRRSRALAGGLHRRAIGIDTRARNRACPGFRGRTRSTTALSRLESAGLRRQAVPRHSPRGFWEVPVYQAYLPTKGRYRQDGRRQHAADKDCVFPGNAAGRARARCYLSEGELKAGTW